MDVAHTHPGHELERIIYISNLRMPTRKAYGFQIVQFLAALVKRGARVELRLPYRKNRDGVHPFAYYHLPTICPFSYVGTFDPFVLEGILGSKAAFSISKVLFLVANIWYSPPANSVVYTRDAEIAWLFSLRGYRTFYNAHNFPRHSRIHTWFLKGVSGIVANSSGTADEYQKHTTIPVSVIPNGVDVERFDSIREEKLSIRTQLQLPEGPVALYAGHLYSWKGADVLLQVAALLPHVTFVFVGGLEADVKAYQTKGRELSLTNVLFLGYKSTIEVPMYEKAADILLLPNVPESLESERYTSPLKLFEYMAANVPIIASDLPSIREVISENTAYLVTAGDPQAFAAAIQTVLTTPHEAGARAASAYTSVRENYTWDAAAQKLIEFIT